MGKADGRAHGRPQVCTQGIARSGDRTVKPWAGVEAVASLALHHPGVMRTLNHTTVVVPVAPLRTVRHASLHMPDISPPGGCASHLPPGCSPVRGACCAEYKNTTDTLRCHQHHVLLTVCAWPAGSESCFWLLQQSAACATSEF